MRKLVKGAGKITKLTSRKLVANTYGGVETAVDEYNQFIDFDSIEGDKPEHYENYEFLINEANETMRFVGLVEKISWPRVWVSVDPTLTAML